MLKKEYSFHVDIKSRLDGRQYEGTFHMRRPDIGDLGAISAALSRMNQGENFTSSQFEVLMTTIATVTVCGENIPDWWGELTADESVADTRVILHVGSKMIKARDKAAPFRNEESSQKEDGD